uniref:Uncharacterized protein n=1 Tax=Alexandrium monilatum TaxID=311494 RepID=A0A7S4W6R4_9DINO
MFSALLGNGEPDAFGGQDPGLEAWQQFDAEERLRSLQKQHPVLPPPFAMPRAVRARWGLLWEGPLRAVVHTWSDERRDADPERLLEERTFDRCRRSMDRRRADSTCVRQSGCQVVLIVLCLLCFLLHVKMRPWQLRSTVLLYFLTMEWTLLLCLLASSWARGVAHCADVIFFWLAATYEEVDSAGASMALSVRRHLLLRVLGLLHCPHGQARELCARLGWGPFPEVLESAASMFHEEQLEVDGLSIETGCLFLDDGGRLQRFVWRLDNDADSGEAGVGVPVTTVVRDLDYADKELSHAGAQPWARRDMSFLVDVRSPEVDRIVESNPWWHKLEFQLKADQSRLSGFRRYLGDTMWTMDYWHLIPHCFLVFGIGLAGNFLAAQVGTACCAKACVNSVMYVLEMQVNRDWAFIMGVEQVDDPEEYWREPGRSRDVHSIPVLWQVTSCRSSLQHVAVQMLQLVDKNRRDGSPRSTKWRSG